MKKSGGIIFILLLIIMVLGGYLVYDKVLSDKVPCDDNNKPTCNETITIDYEELSKFGKSDYNFVNSEYNSTHSIAVLSDGKVLIDFKDNLSNVSHAKDVIVFSGPGVNETAYILTNNGDVYKYEFSEKYEATKLDYTNISSIIRYKTRKANAGGCDYLILIDKDNQYTKLDSYCV